MAKPTVELGGHSYHLNYDFNAIAEIEGALKQTIGRIGRRIAKNDVGIADTRALVWAGILHENEDVTLRDVGAWLTEAAKTPGALDKIVQEVLKGLEAAFPVPKPTDGTNPN